jgi:hypothetical protein
MAEQPSYVATVQQQTEEALKALDAMEKCFCESLQDSNVDLSKDTMEDAHAKLLVDMKSSVRAYEDVLFKMHASAINNTDNFAIPSEIIESYIDGEHFTDPSLLLHEKLLQCKDSDQQVEHTNFIFKKAAEGIPIPAIAGKRKRG